MISGILVFSEIKKMGYPWVSAVLSWARVCDEIVFVVPGYQQAMQYLPEIQAVEGQIASMGLKCNLLVRSFTAPYDVQTYAFFGICMASDPDWALLLEADYLISPFWAGHLRQVLLDAPPESEIVMANAISLNHNGTGVLYVEDYRRSFPPKDGISYYRPIGSRPKLGVFPSVYLGVDRFNYMTDAEGFIRIRAGHWGDSFNSKFLNHNPYGFSILRTDVVIEHLMFTRSLDIVKARLAYEYWVKNQITPEKLLKCPPYTLRYPNLDRVKDDYAWLDDEMKKMAAM
jgi:hypothetical protein